MTSRSAQLGGQAPTEAGGGRERGLAVFTLSGGRQGAGGMTGLGGGQSKVRETVFRTQTMYPNFNIGRPTRFNKEYLRKLDTL